MTISNDYSNYLYVPEELQGVRSSNPLEKIATNKELTKASDDPALLAISDQLNYEQSGLTQGVQNINSALSYLQIGDSALGEQSDILNTIREKLYKQQQILQVMIKEILLEMIFLNF